MDATNAVCMRSSRGESFLRTAAFVTGCFECELAIGFFVEAAGFFVGFEVAVADEDVGGVVDEADVDWAGESCALTKRVHAKHNTNAKRKIRDNCL